MMELRRIRRERALSIRGLARLSGVATATINLAEQGTRKPHPTTIRKLADALGIEPIELIGHEMPERPVRPAPAPDSSHLTAGDLRFLAGLDGLCDLIDRKLRAGGPPPDEIERERATYDTLAPLLGRAMREEAAALRELHPHEHDVAPWSLVGPRVARYTALVMRVIDVDELDHERQEAYARTG